MNISTHREAVEFQRREVKNMLILVVFVAAMFVLFGWTGNNDFADEERREQVTADLACRAAGADHAVRVEADVRSIYICDRARRTS